MNFAACRKSAGMTQEAAASGLSVATVTYGNWERGTNSPSFAQAVEVADLFRCSLDELAGRKGREDPAVESAVAALRSSGPEGREMIAAFAEFVSQRYPA